MISIEEKVRRCIEILEDLYGVPKAEEIDPVDLLISTILSQNTTDVNSLRAFSSLKSSYPNYESLLSASITEISDKIRFGGLSEIKARRIKGTLEKIRADSGSIDLEFLRKMESDEACNYLLSLPGVGSKTAAVVLLFAFAKAAMPVDTHVYRVSGRIGLVPEGASIQDTKRLLEEMAPAAKYMSLHLNLIRHGRRICRARRPLHSDCALKDLCRCYADIQLQDKLDLGSAENTGVS